MPKVLYLNIQEPFSIVKVYGIVVSLFKFNNSSVPTPINVVSSLVTAQSTITLSGYSLIEIEYTDFSLLCDDALS